MIRSSFPALSQRDNPPIEAIKVLKLVQSRRNYRFAGPDRIRVEAKLPDVQTRVAAIREAFRELS